ncbi:MAG: FliA/WhiG family RNA polymerase sigma factor [Desulfobacteraceae bacterium]
MKKDEGNRERERRIVENAYLVKQIAAKFAMKVPSSVLFDELVSAGSLGLIDAVDKFDPDKHVTFKTYARYRIKGAILDELRSMDTYSRTLRKKAQDVSRAVKAVEDRKGAPPEDTEIAGELGLEVETYHDMLADIHGATVLSLDEFVRSKESNTSSGTRFTAGIKGKENPADLFDKEELKSVFAEAVKNLSEKEQMVVSLYYYDDLTLKEIGEVLSLTESRICQIHSGIMLKMKSLLQKYFN